MFAEFEGIQSLHMVSWDYSSMSMSHRKPKIEQKGKSMQLLLNARLLKNIISPHHRCLVPQLRRYSRRNSIGIWHKWFFEFVRHFADWQGAGRCLRSINGFFKFFGHPKTNAWKLEKDASFFMIETSIETISIVSFNICVSSVITSSLGPLLWFVSYLWVSICKPLYNTSQTQAPNASMKNIPHSLCSVHAHIRSHGK